MSRFRYQRGDQPLENYTVEYGLGVGGFGEVYFAVSESGREVALKAVQNYEEIELRGIRHCMNLKSPHLVTVFDVKRNHRGDPFVVMEFVNGPSLRSLLDASPEGLGDEKAAFFLREMAKGLTYLHDSGVVHRDLKPHNVFYENGYVKIGDYSLCKLISATQHSGHTMTVGSVHYMAPEISKGQYDSSVDIYALGAMLYEMLTGQPPFVGESIGEILMKQLNEEPDLSKLQEPFRSVVGRAMAKNPADRFTSAAEMVESIFGSENVHNSVIAFNPQELTIVAGKVAADAKRMRVGAGGGNAGDSSHRFGDPSAWKGGLASDSSLGDGRAGTDSSGSQKEKPSYVAAITESARESLGFSVEQAELANSGHWTAKDNMPWPLRYGLGAGVTAVCTIFVSAIPWSYPEELGFVTGAYIACALLAITVIRRIALRHLPPDSRMPARGLVLFGLAFAMVPCFAMSMETTILGREMLDPFYLAIACFAPCVILNLHPLCHPRRASRLRLGPIVLAAILGFSFSYCMGIPTSLSGDYFCIPIAAIAAGIVMGIQIISPKYRLQAKGKSWA